MSKQDKSLQGLGIPFSALASIIFGLMVLSFPIGAYVVFNSSLEYEIHFDYPLDNLGIFPAGIGVEVPIDIELGDAFVIVWCIFMILFTIAMLGPKKNFLKVLSKIMTDGIYDSHSNYLIQTIKWFSILIVASAVIGFIQESVGIVIEPPEQPNLLLQFFDVTVAPLTEEIGFRVILIGIPLFLAYSHKNSVKFFFKSLWNPNENLHIEKLYKPIILIVLVSIFFGAAHVISGEPWSSGKFAQATVSGIILGWVYLRYGLVSAILIHWATNYLIFSYVYFIADINEVSIQDAFLHSLSGTLEIIFLATGVISIAMILITYLNFRKEKRLEI